MLKGIGIILVMIGHSISGSSFVYNLIYGFHMPLFFFCSGFFFKDKPIIDGTIRDVKGLLIPWLTFSVFLVCCSVILMVVSNGSGPKFNPLDENCYILYYTIWFLICLFIVRLGYRLLHKTDNMLIINILIWGGYIAAYILSKSNINLPFFIDSALAMLAFYHIGYLFKTSALYKKQLQIWIPIVLLVVYVLLVILAKPEIDVKSNAFPLYLIFLSLLPIYALYQICCHIHSNILAHIGIVSLTIMGLHHPIYDVLMFPLMNRLSLPQPIETILVVSLTLGITLLMDKMIMKYVPFLLGKFSK